jgi:hypothetical protein
MAGGRRFVQGIVAAAALVLGATGFAAEAAEGTYKSNTPGLDSCTAPSVSQMQAFWNGSPNWNWYVYIGGSNRSCSQPNLTASWVNQVQGLNGTMFWGLVGIWVGPQAPDRCNARSYGSYISLNTTTARTQGTNEAIAAYNAGRNLFGTTDFPVAYDLEAYTTSDTGCVNAIQSFMSGWTDFLDNSPPQTSGVYGSSCGSNLAAFATISRPPDFIWGAHWASPPNPLVATMPCVNSGHWVLRQRHKQYRGGHNETWNGVTINVDSNCANGPVFRSDDNLFDPADTICE